MIRILAVTASLTLLAACGVDGEPVRPTVNGGVTVSNSGVYPSATISVNRWPVWIGLGL